MHNCKCSPNLKLSLSLNSLMQSSQCKKVGAIVQDGVFIPILGLMIKQKQSKLIFLKEIFDTVIIMATFKILLSH